MFNDINDTSGELEDELLSLVDYLNTVDINKIPVGDLPNFIGELNEIMDILTEAMHTQENIEEVININEISKFMNVSKELLESKVENELTIEDQDLSLESKNDLSNMITPKPKNN